MIFNRIDKDKSGKIDVEELKEYTRKIGQQMSQEERKLFYTKERAVKSKYQNIYG